MKTALRARLLGLALLLLSPAVAAPAWAAGTGGGQEFLLFYSNDNRGETEPCGCQPNQFGGLARKAFQFEQLTKEAGLPSIALDAGDLLFKQATLTPGQEATERLTAAAIAQAYGRIGYKAVGVGGLDLAAGVDFLRKLARRDGFTWLSANLVDKTSQKLVFSPTLSLAVGQARLTVIGLTGGINPPALDLALLPWEKALPPLLAQASQAGEMVVLLSSLPESENRKIAAAYSAINLIIQSQAQADTLSEPGGKQAIIASVTPGGKDIGILKIDWHPGQGWGCPPAEQLAQAKAALDGVTWQLDKYRAGGQDPAAELADKPKRLAAYRELRAKERGLRAEIEHLSACATAEGQAETGPSSYHNRFLALDGSLPEDQKVAAISTQLDRDLNELGRRQAESAATRPDDQDYLGPAACAPCHAELVKAWGRTKHAAAYQTLAAKGQQFNLNCLPCHVTGVSPKQANLALSLPDKRRGVGCEACHGPGRRHAASPQTARLTRQPGPTVCAVCHAPPHDEGFDYPSHVKLVH